MAETARAGIAKTGTAQAAVGWLPGWPWSFGGAGDAGVPAIAQAREPELAPPLKAAALILSSCLHFLVRVLLRFHDFFRSFLQPFRVEALRSIY